SFAPRDWRHTAPVHPRHPFRSIDCEAAATKTPAPSPDPTPSNLAPPDPAAGSAHRSCPSPTAPQPPLQPAGPPRPPPPLAPPPPPRPFGGGELRPAPARPLRHAPPWHQRHWVRPEAGRAELLGPMLLCVLRAVGSLRR